MCYSALVKRDIQWMERHFPVTLAFDEIKRHDARHEEDPKRFPNLEERIFPGSYALVAHVKDGKEVLSPMRYGAYPPFWAAGKHGAFSTFNARRDNLQSPFWKGAFLHHHGYLIFERFYEWVAVKDLLKAGIVRIAEVKAEFARQAEARRAKVLAAGKAYKPTPTELKDPRFRQIIIEFQPDHGEVLVAPVIISQEKTAKSVSDGQRDLGFAIVTDAPLPDVASAGHDRSPVMLDHGAVGDWLAAAGKSAEEADRVLSQTRKPIFVHRIAKAA